MGGDPYMRHRGKFVGSGIIVIIIFFYYDRISSTQLGIVEQRNTTLTVNHGDGSVLI